MRATKTRTHLRQNGSCDLDEIEIAPYDPAWSKLFEAEAARLHAALPADLVLGIEHIGSTAVPGLAAKPVIDILIATPSIEEARGRAVEQMTALGYAFWADNPKPDRLFFVRGLPPAPHRTHHVHFTELTGEQWRRTLPFRDHLRAHPEAAARYAALKRALADAHRGEREAYTDAKGAFVREILEQAGVRLRNPRPS